MSEPSTTGVGPPLQPPDDDELSLLDVADTDSDSDTDSLPDGGQHAKLEQQPQQQQRRFVLICVLLSFIPFLFGYLLGRGTATPFFLSNLLPRSLSNFPFSPSSSSSSSSSSPFLSSSPWSSLPSLALLCRSYVGMWGEMLPTLMLHDIYWPIEYQHSSWVWVLDAESEADHMLGTLLTQTKWAGSRGKVSVRYEAKPAEGMLTAAWRGYGYARQQFSNMYCDQYTDAEYVGIVDSDAWPMRPPIPSDLFSLRADGKYRALLVGYNVVSSWCLGAEYLVGLPCPGEFMIRFPVVVKAAHFRLMREHITAHLQMPSFEQAYQSMLVVYGNAQYGQFNIIATYLWHFHYDEYEWRLNSCAAGQCNNPWWVNKPLYNGSDTRELAKRVLAADIPTAQFMKHTAINTGDKGMLTKQFRFLCVASDYKAGECSYYRAAGAATPPSNSTPELLAAAAVLPPNHVSVQYRNYYTRPGGIFFEEQDSDETAWVTAQQPDIQQIGKRLLDETYSLYGDRWSSYDREEVTFVPYQVAYDTETKTFKPPS